MILKRTGRRAATRWRSFPDLGGEPWH
jgi:hypothetical protein